MVEDDDREARLFSSKLRLKPPFGFRCEIRRWRKSRELEAVEDLLIAQTLENEDDKDGTGIGTDWEFIPVNLVYTIIKKCVHI